MHDLEQFDTRQMRCPYCHSLNFGGIWQNDYIIGFCYDCDKEWIEPIEDDDEGKGS